MPARIDNYISQVRDERGAVTLFERCWTVFGGGVARQLFTAFYLSVWVNL